MDNLIKLIRNKAFVECIMDFFVSRKNRVEQNPESFIESDSFLKIVQSMQLPEIFRVWKPDWLIELANLLHMYVDKIHLSKELAINSKLNDCTRAVLSLSKKLLNPIEKLLKENSSKRLDKKAVEGLYREHKAVIERFTEFLRLIPRRPKVSELYAVMGTLIGDDTAILSKGEGSSRHASVIAESEEENLPVLMTPSKEAWREGVVLAEQVIDAKRTLTGEYPKKVAVNIWGGEFKRSKGRNLAQCLYLLGVEPVWDAGGMVRDVRCIPMGRLKRPRIDVIVQTSGMFRDIGASRIDLINKAVKAVTAFDDEISDDNYVRESSKRAEQIMLAKGSSLLQARDFSTLRTFGAVPGSYGTGIIPLVETGDQWQATHSIAERYINYMGVVYTRKYWGVHAEGLFNALLHDVDTVVQPLSNRKCGPLNLDHIYEYAGGLGAAVTYVTGKEPDIFISDVREKKNPRIRSVADVIQEEKENSFCNPVYIRKVISGDTASTKVVARTFRNTFGWNVLSPSVLPENLWQELYEMYVADINDIGITNYFKKINPYGLQELTGVLLESVRKGFWDPDKSVIVKLAQSHARLVTECELQSNTFVTDNKQLIYMIESYLEPVLAERYHAVLKRVIEQSCVLEKNVFDRTKEMLGSSMAALVSVLILVVLFSGAYVVYNKR